MSAMEARQQRASDHPPVSHDLWVRGPVGTLHVVETTASPEDHRSWAIGDAVLFVHGFAGDATFWTEALAHAAARGRRALAIELRGHGQSESPAHDDYGIPSLARDLDAVVEDLDLGSVVLVGHSLGAAVAGAYAAAHPERVSTLVLVDPAGDNPRLPREQIAPYREALATDQYREAVEQYLTSTPLVGARPAVRAKVLDGLRRAPRGLVVNATLASLDYSVVPALARYRHAGGRAVTITADQNQGPLALHELVEDLPRRHVAGTSHFVAMDDPVGFAHVLDDALSGVVWRR